MDKIYLKKAFSTDSPVAFKVAVENWAKPIWQTCPDGRNFKPDLSIPASTPDSDGDQTQACAYCGFYIPWQKKSQHYC